MATTTHPKPQLDPDAFRDSLATVDAQGRRIWLYPKKPSGRYFTRRAWVGYALIGLLIAGPFLTWEGEPLLRLNVFEREFIILGLPFFPQDFVLFAVTALIFFVFISLFTLVFGRLWCGWACPQTLFMELVFRRIEFWIEGDAGQQRKLDDGPWTAEKILKKTLKHGLFGFVSLSVAHLVMAYLIGYEKTWQLLQGGIAQNIAPFVALVAFTGVFYVVFAKAREQVCVAICPYGRLQSVLLVKESIVVLYDYLRGEPRKPLKRESVAVAGDEPHGDCVDCKLCVQVCPTGIDIRNGTQLECINCTACIDACDQVMDKIGKPQGLIRFDSEKGLHTGKKLGITTRMVAYTGVMLALLALQGYLLLSREPVESTVLRVPGMLFQTTADGHITNLYNVQLVNKTTKPLRLEVRLKDKPGLVKRVGKPMHIPKGGTYDGVFFIELDPAQLPQVKNSVELEFLAGETIVSTAKTNFMGPAH